VCPHQCRLTPGQTGFCRARANRGGQVVSLSYGRLTALALDPIEKKPLRRFHPGSMILSAGSFGCNMRCPFCQNSDISMAGEAMDTRAVSPEELVRQAVALKARGNIGIAYTYNEPFVGYEFVADTARQAHEEGLANVLVTNGLVCEAPLQALLPFIDAMNIDLKCFTSKGYKRLGGDLETVLATIRTSAAECHVEVTTLAVPGLSDSPADMEAEAAWLASVDPEIPLHISRFFPRYHMADAQPTPLDTLQTLHDVAAKRLQYVYLGNC
jgi:pyruvate formate lyase activating enzyme